MKRKRHWYRIEIEECPVCGRGGERRKRVYGKPPPKFSKRRYSVEINYCGCVY